MIKKEIISVIVGGFSSALLFFGLLNGVSCPAFENAFDKSNQAEVLYGKGVHAFFEGNYRETVDFVKQVDKIGTSDPRPFFFMGLALHRLGQEQAAGVVLKKAAEMEWSGRTDQYYNVSEAIRRIQGRERLYVEGFRDRAKAEWQKSEKRRSLELYGRDRDEQDSILQTLSGSFVGAAPFGARSIHPFRSEENKRDEHLIEEHTDLSGKPTTEANVDKTEPKAKKGAVKVDTAIEIDEDEDDPFAETAPKKDDAKVAAKDDMDNEIDEDEDDPFAEAAPKKDEKKDEKKSESEDDPFGEDPFG